MPENLVCPTCGREYPWQVPREYCSTCGTYFTRGTCYICRTYNDYISHGKCRDCAREINRKVQARRRAAAKDDYKQWVEMVASMPKPVKTLTEDEWLNTCKHFNGCALCGKEQIEARVLFIPAHRGGTYTRYNTVPACEACATSYKQTVGNKGDPFSAADYNGLAADRERVKNVKKYLKEQYDEYRKINGIL